MFAVQSKTIKHALMGCIIFAGIACSRAPSGDETPAFPERGASPGGTSGGVPFPTDPQDGDQRFPGGNGTSDTASFTFEVSEAQFAQYVDINGLLAYKFSYLATSRDGSLQFNQGKAQIRIAGLEVGKAGTLSLAILENGVEKLKGARENLTLNAGINQVELKLEPIGGNGEDFADLTIDITYDEPDSGDDDSGGSDNGSGSGTPPPPPGGDALNFTSDIAPLAVKYCQRCHSTLGVDTVAYWTARKTSLRTRLKVGAAGEMPQPGTAEASSISAAERALLLKYVSQ